MNNNRRGMMLIFCAPSGTGKSTITHEIITQDPNVKFSLSATTRKPRDGEEHGVHYHFMDDKEYDETLGNGGFLEHASVFKHKYGTLKAPVMKSLDEGHDVIFDIDWQGARQLKETAPNDCVLIYILPPSLKELKRRLVSRNKDNLETIEHRMNEAKSEVSHYGEFDYIVKNDNLQDIMGQINSIIICERLKKHRNLKAVALAESILQE